MSDGLVLNLLPLVVGAALAPGWIILLLLLLSGPGGRAKGAAFVAGPTLVRLVQGVIFGALFGASPAAAGQERAPSPVLATLLLVVGLLMLVTAFKTWRSEDDPDAPPPKLYGRIQSLTAPKAFAIGAALLLVGPKFWIFTASAVATIRDAGLPVGQSAVVYLLYIVGAELLLVVPVVAASLAPRQSAAALRGATTWLEGHNQPITIAVTLLFGCIFLWRGATGLLASR